MAMNKKYFKNRVVMKDHPVGMMESVTLRVGKILLADITHDKRVDPPWCARYGHHNGWKNSDLRFETKNKAINHVLDRLGIDERVKS